MLAENNIPVHFQNLKCRIDDFRIELEAFGKQCEIQLICFVITRADGNFEKITQSTVRKLNLIDRRKLCCDPLYYFFEVIWSNKWKRSGRIPVSSRTSCFLEVSFRVIGKFIMRHKTDIRFVYSHSESIGSHHNRRFYRKPIC